MCSLTMSLVLNSLLQFAYVMSASTVNEGSTLSLYCMWVQYSVCIHVHTWTPCSWQTMVLFLALLQVRLQRTPAVQVTVVTSLEARRTINCRRRSSRWSCSTHQRDTGHTIPHSADHTNCAELFCKWFISVCVSWLTDRGTMYYNDNKNSYEH